MGLGHRTARKLRTTLLVPALVFLVVCVGSLLLVEYFTGVDPEHPTSTPVADGEQSHEGKPAEQSLRGGFTPPVAGKPASAGTFAHFIAVEWLSAVPEGELAVSLRALNGSGIVRGKLADGRLGLPATFRLNADYAVEYVAETSDIWFPAKCFRLTESGVCVSYSDAPVGDRPQPALFAVATVKCGLLVALPRQMAVDGTAVSFSLRASPPREVVRAHSQLALTSWTLPVIWAPESGPGSVVVPAWPLSAIVTGSDAELLAVDHFSHRGKVASAGDLLKLTLTRSSYCTIEVWEASPGDFRAVVEAAAARDSLKNPEDVRRSNTERPHILRPSLFIYDAESGRRVGFVPHPAGIDPVTLTSTGGVVHSFRCRLNRLDGSLIFVLGSGGHDPAPMALGAATIDSAGSEHTVALQSATRPTEKRRISVVTDAGQPVPYHALDLELVLQRPEKPLRLFDVRLAGDAGGMVELESMPLLDGTTLRVRSAPGFSPLLSATTDWVTLPSEFTEHIVRVEIGFRSPLVLKLRLPPGEPIPAHVRYLILPVSAEESSTADYSTGVSTTDGAWTTAVYVAGRYLAVVSWGGTVVARTIDFDPRSTAVCNVSVDEFRIITFRPGQSVFMQLWEADATMAWSVSSLLAAVRGLMFPQLSLTAGKENKVRVPSDTPIANTNYFGLLPDGTLVTVLCEDGAASGEVAVTVQPFAKGGSVRVSVSETGLAALEALGDTFSVVVTPYFSESNGDTSALVGLGRQVELTGEATLVEGVPAGRYLLVILARRSGSPVPLGERWMAIVTVAEGTRTSAVLPKD